MQMISSTLANQSRFEMNTDNNQYKNINKKDCIDAQKYNIKNIDNSQNQNQQKNLNLNVFNANKIPQTMKIFLKQKRKVSKFLQNQQTKQKKLIQKMNQNKNVTLSQTQQQILQNELKKLQFINVSRKIIPKLTQQINKTKLQKQNVCNICQGQIQQKMSKHKIFNCEHIFCKECTKSYIQYKIKMFQQICCPNQNCKEFLNQKAPFYCNQISLKQRKLYLKIHQFFTLHKSNQHKKLCPKQQCQGIITINLNLPTLKCQTCRFQFCSKCLAQAHSDQCEDYETKFLKENFNLVKCDKCNNFIQKSEGCNHISCKCGYEFCQKCKLTWRKNHICKYTGLTKVEEGWGGCDWGITKKDHFLFLLKIPIKIFLMFIIGLAWIIFSFLGVPLNVILFIYWLYLLLIRPSCVKILNENDGWKVFCMIVIFPVMMIINIPDGKNMFIDHLDGLFPQVSNSFRWIIKL